VLTLSDKANGNPQASNDDAPSTGALLGPAGPPQATMPDSDSHSAPSSPYTAQRTAIRDLTLPTKPNLEIPSSPPASPTPDADQKFAHFLELKKQGIHFNAKLASSSALKNPSLLPKLMQFAAVEDEKQYATTLPTVLWDPLGFPEWAYKEELASAQKEVSKKKEEERAETQRESIDFVSAGTSAQTSRGGTPGIPGGMKGMRGSAAERVMAGLDRERKAVEGRWRSPKRRKRSRSR